MSGFMPRWVVLGQTLAEGDPSPQPPPLITSGTP